MTEKILNIPVNIDSCFVEEFRVLRARIELLCKEKKSIMVTSMLTGEGKTTVALNLARSLASVGKRVIFVDCDLRNSKIAANCGVKDTTVSIQSYLSGHKELEEVILKSNKENLDFIISGGLSLNSAELFESQRFHTMLTDLREKYDFIIIDTPPMTKFVDATIISRETDAVILVIQENKVRKQMLEIGLEQLKETSCDVVGVVYNKLDL